MAKRKTLEKQDKELVKKSRVRQKGSNKVQKVSEAVESAGILPSVESK